MDVIRIIYSSVSGKTWVSMELKSYEIEQIVGQLFGSCEWIFYHKNDVFLWIIVVESGC